MEQEIREQFDKIELMFKTVIDAVKENEKQITMLKNDLYNHKKDFQQAILDEQAKQARKNLSLEELIDEQIDEFIYSAEQYGDKSQIENIVETKRLLGIDTWVPANECWEKASIENVSKQVIETTAQAIRAKKDIGLNYGLQARYEYNKERKTHNVVVSYHVGTMRFEVKDEEVR